MSNKAIATPSWRSAAIDAAILAVAMFPFFITAHVPLTDLPNHLARQYIIRDLASSPALQKFYEVHWALVPNLALDLFVYAAREIMPIDVAVRLFCIASVALIFLGTRRLSETLGEPASCAYRAFPLLIYGGPFQFGFLNYCFGVGLAALLFDLYLRCRAVALPRLVVIFIPASAILLLCHIAAFGIYAVAVSCYELDQAVGPAGYRALPRRFGMIVQAAMRAGCHLLPALIVFVAFGPPGNSNGPDWRDLHTKLEGFAAITMYSNPNLELPLLAIVLAGLAIALWSGAVRLRRPTLAILAGFTVTWLALPRSAFGGGFLDYRIPWTAAFFLLAGLSRGTSGRRVSTTLGATFAALSVMRIAMIASLWWSWEPLIAEADESLARIPLGATVMVVVGRPPSVAVARSPSVSHLASYAVARREAFEPNIFADFSGQILFLKPPYNSLWLLYIPQSLDEIDSIYTHLLVLRPQFAHLSPNLPLTVADRGALFTLYTVQRPTRR